MPSNQTQNYSLNQWSKDDQILMEDFNADNAKIDAALAQKAEQSDLAALTALVGTPLQMAAGHYAGDGQATRFISTGFTPRAVFVIKAPGTVYYASSPSVCYGGLAVTDYPACNSTVPSVEIVSGGFKVFFSSADRPYIASNQNNENYNYVALG